MENLAVIGVGIIVAIIVIALRQRPLDDRTDDDPSSVDSSITGYPPGSRPAGPGAEGMGVPDPGEIIAGTPEADQVDPGRPRD